MNCIYNFIITITRKSIKIIWKPFPLGYDKYVDIKDQEANDYIYNFLQNKTNDKGKMVSKFGTTELSNIVAYHYEINNWSKDYTIDVLNYNASFNSKHTIKQLCKNSGFFPCDLRLGKEFYNRMLSDIQEIDVLGSYIYEEKYIEQFLTGVRKRVNLEGFYAPFLWKNPWTRILKGKRVLVVHPFTESIRYQYEHNRDKIWENPEVLPEFKELLTIKAVQSIADEKNQPYKDWFEALKYMEDEINKLEFDIALIGCGAYGMCLAAHVKRMGKIAIHLAGWTQMLFGVYGNRWINDQPQYSKFINEYWIRPNENERPRGAEKVEKGCYW
ncbi:hypothetical protein [Bacteroides caecigallinarum]|uniref:hypothetical protein n=1 Tax=Bacteroides caecigallinarum TaxID=1411144 RepID=UPI001F30E263|nr:hypothetical protein [Bacteroides caecigallinarum]